MHLNLLEDSFELFGDLKGDRSLPDDAYIDDRLRKYETGVLALKILRLASVCITIFALLRLIHKCKQNCNCTKISDAESRHKLK